MLKIAAKTKTRVKFLGGLICSDGGGQFTPTKGGQFQRFFHTKKKIRLTLNAFCKMLNLSEIH